MLRDPRNDGIGFTIFIQKEKPDLAFIYIGTVDTTGHGYGWMSDKYLKQLELIDSLLGDFFESLASEYTSIVHSDHAGYDRNPGIDSLEDMMIPWMAVGPNIKKGYTIQSQIRVLDTAPTIPRILEVLPHHEWERCAVEEIFQ